jgi:hypothetical protein
MDRKCSLCSISLSKKNTTGKCRKCYKKEYEYAYCIKRYNSDPEFAKKQKSKSSNYQKLNLLKVLSYNRKYRTKREKVDIEYRLANSLRSRLTHAISNNQKSGSAVSDLGCSIAEFKTYLESLFLPGMSWDNYGEWHIDHIIPLSKYSLSNREELLEACNYKNLQPLWAIDNLKKGNRNGSKGNKKSNRRPDKDKPHEDF